MAIGDTKISSQTAEHRRPRDEERDMFGITHPGKVRKDNQDHFLICTVYPQVVIDATSLPAADELPLRGSRLATLLLVADGVGGSDSGAEASRLAAETITKYVATALRCYHAAGSANEDELLESLRAAVFQAHDVVRAEAATRADPKPMATTLTLALAVWPWMFVVQVGDSRCYYWDGATLHQVTTDQTIAQHLVDSGALPKERLNASPFKNVLASAIGGAEATPQVTRVALQRSGALVMCSDGLTRHVTNEEIAERVRATTSSEQLCRDLLDLALERGGTDNITIVAGRAPLRAAAASPDT
jgi:protein phosphatase